MSWDYQTLKIKDRVGIGTTTPSRELHVKGKGQFDDELDVGSQGNPGNIYVTDATGRRVINIAGSTNYGYLHLGSREEGHSGHIQIYDSGGQPTLRFSGKNAALHIGLTGNGGWLQIWDDAGRCTFRFGGNNANLEIGGKGNDGSIFIRDDAGSNTIQMNGNTGDIVLQGADCAEEFELVEVEKICPGMVMVIDGDSKLRPCREPYDNKVVGVVSGGNGLGPGIILGKNPIHNRRLPIALNGKVYCKVDAQSSPIEVGDLLTTSPTLGHAMKASDPSRAFGAVIGKALRSLYEGTGLIPILVALQ